MSWQCPTCETVNQDVTPICTVCDTLAPVIESFLSLESIECLREYNAKLDEVHRLEVSGNYNTMLETALEAMAIYKENGIAVDKAKQALKRSNEALLINQLTTLLNSTIEEKNYLAAIAVIRVIENLHIDVPGFASLKSEVKLQLTKEKDIDDALNNSYKAIVQLKLDEAYEIVESGLEKYPSSKLLQYRREEIKSLKTIISDLQNKVESKKKRNRMSKYHSEPDEPKIPQPSGKVISLDKKRKFPKIRRNDL